MKVFNIRTKTYEKKGKIIACQVCEGDRAKEILRGSVKTCVNVSAFLF